jgi:hypothetical protein
MPAFGGKAVIESDWYCLRPENEGFTALPGTSSWSLVWLAHLQSGDSGSKRPSGEFIDEFSHFADPFGQNNGPRRGKRSAMPSDPPSWRWLEFPQTSEAGFQELF